MGVSERDFLEVKLYELENKAKDFQKKCDNSIEDKSHVLLCLPTGSGKTNRFLIWSIKKLLASDTDKKIIITAPIKSLSNQRFRDLYLEGYNVGIETGDIKYNTEECTILCCTQEIATFKYLSEEYITIIDEFHYIYNDSSRSKVYIEYLVNNNSSNVFLCSATFGDVAEIGNYINKITGNDYYIYSDDTRLTSLHYMDKMDLKSIKDSFVVSFSSNDCVKNANRLRKERCKNKNITTKEREELVLKTATKYQITNNDLIANSLSGIAYYFGRMLPKEKLFVEELFSLKVIDTVFGTDALSLGVNFPIKNVVLTSLRKSNKLISKNLFEQISGRAGRYGLYDEGFIYYCDEFGGEKTLKEDFETCKNAKKENIKIKLLPTIKNILLGNKTIEDEIEFIKECSIEPVNENFVREKIESELRIVRNFDILESYAQFYFNRVVSPKYYKEIDLNNYSLEKLKGYKKKYGYISDAENIEFNENIALIYNDEFNALDNCILLRDIICKRSLDEIVFDMLRTKKYERRFRDLLQLRKHLNSLPDKYRQYIDLVRLDEIILGIDKTVFDIEIAFEDNMSFEKYQSTELNKLLTQEDIIEHNKNASMTKDKKITIDKHNKKEEDKKNKKEEDKKEIVIKKIERLFDEGTILKDGGASFGSPKYLLLMYTEENCILINYNLYKMGTISFSIEDDLSKYLKVDNLDKLNLKKALITCKFNSETFLMSQNSKKQDVKLIKKLLRKVK